MMESFSTPKLYRERPSVHLDKTIEELKECENSAIELSESERGEVLSFEDALGAQFELVNDIKSSNLSIYLEYFESEKGREDFNKVFGIELPSENIDRQSQELFLYQHEAELKKIDAKSRGEFEGRSRAYFIKLLSDSLVSTLDVDGNIDISVITEPSILNIKLRPEKSLKKVKALRELKRILKEQYAVLESESSQINELKMGIINLYAKRINEMLTSASQSGRPLLKKQEAGVELNDVEKELIGMVYQVEDPDRITSRYDKFEHGASHELNTEGYYAQIGSDLAEFANEYAKDYNESIKRGREQMRERGLDSEKVRDESRYNSEEVEAFAEEILQSYDLLSAESPDTYRPDRVGPASDDKWQVIVSEQFTSMSVDGGRRVVKIPKKFYSAQKLFTVALAHEIEGHVLQHTNKLKLGLRLFNKIGSDRSAIFAEGGAMYNQDVVSREAFGVSSSPNPHYIRAMVTKLKGGTYADCVQTYYDSATEPYKEMRDTGEINQEQFDLEAKRNIKVAITSARRLLRGGGNHNSTKGLITSSKDTAYLEGLILAKKLKEANLQKYMYLTKVNIDTLIFLLKSGLLSTKDIQAPTYKTLEIWEREKEKFILPPSEG